MFANWLLVSVSIGYIGLLFLIAHLGGKYRNKLEAKQQTIIYALSLGVYCTSWGFLGTTAQAADHSFTFLSVYLAPIVLFVFAWPFIQRIIKTSLQLKITSIADLLSARFGKSQTLAIIITLVALIGTMPYIALQLKAIVNSYQILQETQDLPIWQIGLVVSIILAVFTIIFGIRTIDITERHPGVMIAIAFESLVKLIAFLLVGLFVSFIIYDSPADIWELSKDQLDISKQFEFNNLFGLFGMLIIVMSAFLCLPRQFQVMFVEIKDKKTSGMARWVLPVYLLIFGFFAAVLGLAGNLNYGSSLAPDAYVLFLPALDGHVLLSLFAFLGAVSAASSMVIVSTIALSTMLSNEIVFPVMFNFSRKKQQDFNHFQLQLLFIRKALVLLVIFLSYGLLLLSPPDTLSSLGEVAFGAIAQIGPALFVAFYWRKATLAGVLAGISCGFTIWTLFNLLPQLGIYAHPFADTDLPKTTVITLIGLLINVIVLWLVSLGTRQSIREQMQSEFFYKDRKKVKWSLPTQPKVDVVELELLVARFIGEEKANHCFKQFHSMNQTKDNKKFNEAILFHAENTLARVLGSASAKLVTSLAISSRGMAFDQVAKLVEDNSTQQLDFSRTVLQSAIENVSEGISVIDSELKLVAWNKQYLDIFGYPEEFIYIGCPISQLTHFNLSQQGYFAKDIDLQVKKRIQYIMEGSRHNTEYKLKNGKNIRIEGSPIPGGGFVMIFSDITQYRQTEEVLKEENTDLESRVQFRTAELEQANKELALANQELLQAQTKAEQAHIKKSQYLKACSHDLLQPLSAARLFSSAISLSPRVTHEEREQIKKIDNSLEIANSLLLDLNEIARIESGNITPTIEPIEIKELFTMLANEFNALTDEYHIEFHCKMSKIYVASDITLLARIVQNFLSNAFRYAHKCDKSSQSKVLLGCRRQGNEISIQVFDNGPGIPIDKQQQVFDQFTQLNNSNVMGPKGLGLGLNIAQSLAKILEHKIDLKSKPGHGCLFSVNAPITLPPMEKEQVFPPASMSLHGVGVLCIDNEPAILDGMSKLLSAWQCQVFTAVDAQQAKELYAKHEDEIDILLVDYQLTGSQEDNIILATEMLMNERNNNSLSNETVNGIGLIQQLRAMTPYSLPAILITATTDENLMALTKQHNIGYLRKIIKPLALRALMSSLLTEELAKNYSQHSI